jgi:hypothetical protein
VDGLCESFARLAGVRQRYAQQHDARGGVASALEHEFREAEVERQQDALLGAGDRQHRVVGRAGRDEPHPGDMMIERTKCVEAPRGTFSLARNRPMGQAILA